MKWNIYDAGDVVVLCPEFTRPNRGQFVESIVGVPRPAPAPARRAGVWLIFLGKILRG